ncbi:MAG: hypothetical protein E7623_06450, partial [Ruminococcaceae bacterium]|nr:hypothetical protein [Oscillospiraceae bacterium]
MANKNLGELFARYTPTSEEFKDILTSCTEFKTRIEREKRMIEVDASFGSIIPKKVLYELETELKNAYELRSVRIFPKYPEELFSKAYIPEVLTELQRTGAVSRGFFNDYSIEIKDGKINIYIAFTNGGIELLCSAQTPDIISSIIKKEFGIALKVEIKQETDCGDKA